MTRVIKEADERKHEILKTAIMLFSQNGYEKTSISDIAKEAGIAQGLCYRYFSSKEELFDCAVNNYADIIVDKMKIVLCDNTLTLKQKLINGPSFLDTEGSEGSYYKMFHGEQSKKIHDQLSLRICEIVSPIVKEQIDIANEKRETNIEDSETAASFCIYGQLGILLNNNISSDEKIKRIREFIIYTFKL